MQLVSGETVPFSRLLWRSKRRSWSRGEREVTGPRRESEGSERETTRPEAEHLTPSHVAEEQASEPVQLERRLPWVSVWRRKRVRALVSFGGEAERNGEKQRKRMKQGRKVKRETLFMFVFLG